MKKLLLIAAGRMLEGFAQADTMTISGTGDVEDTGLMEVYATRNSGALTWGYVGSKGAGKKEKTLLRFNLSSLTNSLGAGETLQINSATLHWRAYDNFLGTNTLDIYEVSAANAGWVEGTSLISDGNAKAGESTWSYRSYATTNWAGSAGMSTAGTDYISTPVATVEINGNAAAGYTIFDESLPASLVQGWADDESSNGGLLFDMDAGTSANVYMWTSEYSVQAAAPSLTVDYTVVPEPATIGLFSISGLGVLLMRRVLCN